MAERTVAVIGAGVIGASAAFALARRGVRVHCV
jgi:glycine/D-amino acid oxidase-like deaminating enzyme